MPVSTTDRIEKEVLIAAPRARVWRAISDSEEFGAWFGVKFEDPFTAGQVAKGRITEPPEYAHIVFEFTVEQIEPERLIAFRWHPYAVDPGYDYSGEPTTLIEMTLTEVSGGTLLRVVESGFDGVPLKRRAAAFEMNTDGWATQVENVRKYVESHH